MIVTAGRKYGGSITECGVRTISGDRLDESSWHECAPLCSGLFFHNGRIALAYSTWTRYGLGSYS